MFIAKFKVGSVLTSRNITDAMTWEIWGSHGYVDDDDVGFLTFDDIYIGI
jgi:hypothetical protein